MYLLLTQAPILVRDRSSVHDIHIETELTYDDVARRLQKENAGYLDRRTQHAHINALWLRSRFQTVGWDARVDELLINADRRRDFDGLFLKAAVHIIGKQQKWSLNT